jgi:hypothetical protein
MKGVNNRQKMIVTPREHIEKRTLTARKIKSREIAKKMKFGMQKSRFQRRIF